jgi:hypothetical protein
LRGVRLLVTFVPQPTTENLCPGGGTSPVVGRCYTP